MADALSSGRRFRTLNDIDELNREALRIKVYTSLPARHAICVLNELMEVLGAPLSIRLDNGPEFIALNHIHQQSQPMQSAYVDRFKNLLHRGAGLLRLGQPKAGG